jgi:hypothetical protein
MPVRNSTHVNVARNAIMADHAGGDVVIMEDDVPWFYGANKTFDPALRPGSAPASPRVLIDELSRMGFTALSATGLAMWGIYPVSYSGAALKPRLGVGSLFCVGHAVGLRLRGWTPRLQMRIKEDYELSALAVERWGSVVRLDLIAPYSISGHGSGGTATYRNPALESDAVDELLTRWPHLFKDTGKLREGLRQVKMLAPEPVRWTTVHPEPGWNYGR